MKKLTPVFVVERIEPCLDFWVNRLGFARIVEVPHGESLGSMILARDNVEIMYQTRNSVREDVPAALGGEPPSWPASPISARAHGSTHTRKTTRKSTW